MKLPIHPSWIVLALLLGAAIALGPSPVSAQQNQSEAADVPDAEIVVDDDVRITDWSHDGQTYVVDFYSTERKTVTLWTVRETDGNEGDVEVLTPFVAANGTTTVRVDSTEAVTLYTSDSFAEGDVNFLRPSSNSILPDGPYSGTDVRDAGIGSALAVAFAVLYTAVQAKVSGGERGERVV